MRNAVDMPFPPAWPHPVILRVRAVRLLTSASWEIGCRRSFLAAGRTMPAMTRAFIRIRLVILALVAACCLGSAWAQTPDPLPSWNDGPVKKSITDFVPRVTTVGSPDFVPADQR